MARGRPKPITWKQLERQVRAACRDAGLKRQISVTPWTAREERQAADRDHGYVYPNECDFHFSAKILALPQEHRDAIVAHEVGHCLAQKHWGSSTEDEADAAAQKWLSTKICYDPTWSGKGLQVVCSRAANPSLGVRRGTPPPVLSGYLLRSAIDARYRGVYFVGDTQIAWSRTTPAPDELPIGTWRYDDTHRGMYGHEIDELVEIDPRLLEPGEFDWSSYQRDLRRSGKLEDAERYAQWLAQGNVMPPATVVQTERGTLKLVDGHRRTAAADLIGMPVRAWISWLAPHPEGLVDSNGRPMHVGLTYEIATRRSPNPRQRRISQRIASGCA